MQLLETGTRPVTTTLFSADRISRLGDKSLGRFRLDQASAATLCQHDIGLFAEGFLRLDTMLGRLLQLAHKPRSSRTIVLYPSRESGGGVHKLLVEDGWCNFCRKVPEQWTVGPMTFSSIEALRDLPLADSEPIDSVVLLDPDCMVYRARTMRMVNGCTHDRPQIIADFLTAYAPGVSRPVFMMMTCQRAAALPTDCIARVFCRQAWWYLDGPTLSGSFTN